MKYLISGLTTSAAAAVLLAFVTSAIFSRIHAWLHAIDSGLGPRDATSAAHDRAALHSFDRLAKWSLYGWLLLAGWILAADCGSSDQPVSNRLVADSHPAFPGLQDFALDHVVRDRNHARGLARASPASRWSWCWLAARWGSCSIAIRPCRCGSGCCWPVPQRPVGPGSGSGTSGPGGDAAAIAAGGGRRRGLAPPGLVLVRVRRPGQTSPCAATEPVCLEAIALGVAAAVARSAVRSLADAAGRRAQPGRIGRYTDSRRQALAAGKRHDDARGRRTARGHRGRGSAQSVRPRDGQ